MHLTYPRVLNVYSHEELLHILKALGFPRNLFEKNTPQCVDNLTSVESLLELCDDRYFHNDLHNTVNMKSGGYNVETLKKSLVLVASKHFSFEELEKIRLAFETYEEFDQRGLKAEVSTLLRTFKICGRVMAPLRLSNKLRHLQAVLKEKGRIELSEFLDLLTLCDRVSDSGGELKRVGATDKTSRNIYHLDEMGEMILPKDERIWNILDRRYVEEESKYIRPPSASKLFSKKPVSSEHFQAQVEAGNRQFARTRNRLKSSAKQIQRSKIGVRSHINTELSAASGRMSSAYLKSAASSGVRVRKLSLPVSEKSSRRSSLSATATMKSAPNAYAKKMRLKKNRAHSGPPLVNDTKKSELQTQVKDLQFDIETQQQRWDEHARYQVAKYIYHSDEVLNRIRKPPPAPGVRKKRTKTPKQPPAKFTRRMAEPGPMLPRHHATHCDAISRGFGDDSHAVALQSYGVKVKKKKEVRKAGEVKTPPTTRNSFLRTLLQHHNDPCTDIQTTSLNTLNRSEAIDPPRSDRVTDDVVDHLDQQLQREVNPGSQVTPVLELATDDSRKKAKFKEAYHLLCSGIPHIFLDSEASHSSSKHDPSHPSSCSSDIITRLTSSSPQPDLVESEFEKYLKSKPDFIIPEQEMKDYDEIHLDSIKQHRSFRRLRARSATTQIKAL